MSFFVSFSDRFSEILASNKHSQKHNLEHQITSMYFIVRLKRAHQRLIVPHSWILDINKHVEKFMNNGLNKNQTFVVFWTGNSAAFDENDVPRAEFKPKLNGNRAAQFPDEGLYDCNIMSCRSKFWILFFISYIVRLPYFGISFQLYTLILALITSIE